VAIHCLRAPLPEHHRTDRRLDLVLQIAGDELAFVVSYLRQSVTDLKDDSTHNARDISTFPAQDIATPMSEDVETLASGILIDGSSK